MVPPVPLASVTLLSPVMVTTALLVPVMSKLAEVTVPVQVSPAPQVRTAPVETATVEAEVPATMVPKSRSDVLVTVICLRMRALAVAEAVTGAACAMAPDRPRVATRAPATARLMILFMKDGPFYPKTWLQPGNPRQTIRGLALGRFRIRCGTWLIRR